MWTEEFPYYNASKALRWSKNFVYINNSINFDGGLEALSGSEYDIATDTKSFHTSAGYISTVKVGMHGLLNFVQFSIKKCSRLIERHYCLLPFLSFIHLYLHLE